MDPKQENEALKREIAALRAELTATQAVLAEKDAQLQRILNTLGWRMLSKYGRFKHGVLLPAAYAAGKQVFGWWRTFDAEAEGPPRGV